MIENSIIESAKLIRFEFNKLMQKLTDQQKDFTILAESFIRASEELKDIEKSLTNKDTIETIKEKAMSKLNPIDIESQAIIKKISDINTTLEKLRKEESDLYKTIKKRYPTISDLEIREEIERRII
jgi:hypothetical protein